MTEGLAGQWVQPYYLHALVSDAGGVVASEISEDTVVVTAQLPRAS